MWQTCERKAAFIHQVMAGDVDGCLEFRRWTDAEARSHAKHEVVASEVQFLDPPRTGAAPTESAYAPGEEPF
ncbi:MAG TPA: hypothetical protein VK988_04215 [Acidimicrobiales bacterium]|nr:hypothetical protein [Acidimicrobiales bacterium]